MPIRATGSTPATATTRGTVVAREVNAKDPAYGATGDGSTDDTAALQAALDAAGPTGSVFLPPGTYKTTDMLGLPSGCVLAGASKGRVAIQQTTSGTPVLVSKNWPTSKTGAGPLWSTAVNGETKVQDLSLMGAGGSGAHGLVLRDYWCEIYNVDAINCGGHGFYLTPNNSSGAAVGGTLNENRFERCKARSCGTAASGYGFFLGDGSNGKTTDGFLVNCVVDAGSGSQPSGHCYIGAAGGWIVEGLHTYGLVSAASVKIVNGFRTRLSRLYIETYWQAGIYLNLTQQTVWVGDTHIARSQTNASGAGVLIDGQSTFSPLVWLNSLCVQNESGGTALTAISNSNSPVTATVLAPGLKTIGTNITNAGGAGSASITFPY